MAKVIAYMANGLEEVECLAVVDVLRRAGIEVILTSIHDRKKIEGAHHIFIGADALAKDVDASEADLIFLPGGMPGTRYLGECEIVTGAVKQAVADGRRVAAICAAPSVLGELHLLEGRKATCYPGFEDKLYGAQHVSDGVVTDGNITTCRGLGYAVALGLELIKLLISEEKSLEIKAAIQRD
ncbi:MAG: DJ-1 family glyoxalase III [Lachnospiraceae bacterium]